MSNTVKLFESIQANLKEADNTDFFKTTGLEIAKSICKDNNQHCKEVSIAVVEEANNRGIKCSVERPMVIYNGEIYNTHYAILENDKIIDYTYKQFANDTSTVEYCEIPSVGHNYYYVNKDGSINSDIANQIARCYDKDLDELINLTKEKPILVYNI